MMFGVVGIDVERHDGAADDLEQRDAEHRAEDAALAPGERDAADDHGRDHLELEAHAEGLVGRAVEARLQSIPVSPTSSPLTTNAPITSRRTRMPAARLASRLPPIA